MKIKTALTFFGWPLLLLPTILFYFGMGLNAVCTISNGGMMPVLTTNCAAKFEALVDPEQPDMVHVCMTPKSRMKPLADILAQNSGWFSIGDEFVDFGSEIKHLCYALWVTVCGFCLIRKEKFYLK